MASRNFTWPINPSVTGPIEFLVDGAPVNVAVDTGNPANSVPLPVQLLDSGGIVVVFTNNYGSAANALRTASQIGNSNGAADFGSGNVSAQTLRAAIASDQLSTLASQTTLSALNGKFGSLGQKTMAGSAPVVIASDQSTLPVSAASLPLPTGAATEVTLSALNGKFNSLGQKTMANSAPVVISSDQSAIPASQSGTWNITNVTGTVSLPTGASTSALQTTGNTSLSNIDTKLPANLGQKASSASLAVVLASDQSAIKQAANTAGNSPGSGSVSTVTTLNAPANAVGFILMNLDTSAANLRYRIGATATTTSGQQLQPGRDTGYIPCAANISIVAESGTVAYDIQWVLSQ